VDEKQKGNSFRKVTCPQCQTEYIIILPNMGLIANILEGVDSLVKKGDNIYPS
jgi:E3 ubiquitin-protein ligase MARCH5